MNFSKTFTHICAAALLASLLTGCDVNMANSNDNGHSKQTKESKSKQEVTHVQPAANAKKIRLLVLYNAEAAKSGASEAETKIIHKVAVSNKIYKDSGVGIYIEIAAIVPYAINNTMSSSKALVTYSSDPKVRKLRETYQADEVVLFRDFANDGRCGTSYLNRALNPSLAYAHVTIGCPSYVLAHELGHTMGLAHSAHDPQQGRTRYARGYGQENDFSTVMAYSRGQAKKIYKFSSPNLQCHHSQCGSAPGEANEADAVRSLNESASIIAAFR